MDDSIRHIFEVVENAQGAASGSIMSEYETKRKEGQWRMAELRDLMDTCANLREENSRLHLKLAEEVEKVEWGKKLLEVERISLGLES